MRRPQRDSNPRTRDENPVSWAGLDDGDLRSSRIGGPATYLARGRLAKVLTALRVYCTRVHLGRSSRGGTMNGLDVYLLGAGASHGSLHCEPNPPPLAGDLYGELIQRPAF